MSSAVRLGVVGLGTMGRNHVRVARGLPELELTAVFDPQPGPTMSGEPIVGSLDELIEAVDAAVVAVPTEDHLAVAGALVSARKHVLVEKPLAHDVDAAEQLAAAGRASDVVVAVGHIERFNAAVRELGRRLAAGELGEVHQVSTSRQGPFPARIKDVGVVKDLATHDIDLVQFISGRKYQSVSARTAHRSGRPHEDLVSAVCTLDDGTIVNHMVNWLTPTKERQVVVTGEMGRFVADTLTSDLTFWANASVPTEWDQISRFRGVSEGDMIRYAFPKAEPLQTELEGFRDAIALGKGDIVTAHEGVDVLRVAEAMLTSAANGTAEAIV